MMPVRGMRWRADPAKCKMPEGVDGFRFREYRRTSSCARGNGHAEGRQRAWLQMAQVWQRLADEYAGSSAPLFRPIESEQPAMQQQQQIQPKDDDKQN